MNSKCIIFCGLKGSGKDTCVEYLKKKDRGLGGKSNKYFHTTFAGSVKDESSMVYGVERSLFDNVDLKDEIVPGGLKMSPRDMCLVVGKEGRNKDLNYWINKTIRSINLNLKRGQVCLVSDCRYPNEMQSLKDYFGFENVLTVWISRFKINSSSHETENSLSEKDCSVVINNHGDLEQFFKKLDWLLTLIN